ncbi:unnamed protein product, partial [Prorocentrum cordatum]
VLLWILAAVAIACYCARKARRRRRDDEGPPLVAAPNLEDFKMADPRDGKEGQVVAVVGFGSELNSSCNAGPVRVQSPPAGALRAF